MSHRTSATRTASRPALGASLVGALLLVGCSLEIQDQDAPAAGGSGTVTEPWTQYCVATFTDAYEVIDSFGDTELTARPGDAYLMIDYSEFFGEDRAALAYLTDYGPYEFEVTAPLGTRDFPFTTNCEFESGTSYYAVFADVTVFADEALTMELCKLEAGMVMPAGSGQRGYSLAGDLSLFGPLTYEVYLDAFSGACGGAETGYVEAPQVTVLGVMTNLVPLQSIIGP